MHNRITQLRAAFFVVMCLEAQDVLDLLVGDVVSDRQLMESVGLILNECCDCVLKLLPLLYLLCHFDGVRLLLGDRERSTGGTHSCRYYGTNWVTSGPRGAITLLHDAVSQ